MLTHQQMSVFKSGIEKGRLAQLFKQLFKVCAVKKQWKPGLLW